MADTPVGQCRLTRRPANSHPLDPSGARRQGHHLIRSGFLSPAITPLVDPLLSTDRHERAESRLNIENADPTEKAERKQPTDPMDSADPTDPIDSTDPLDPIDKNESCEAMDQRELFELPM